MLLSNDTTPAIQDISTNLFTVNEMKAVMKHLNAKKTLDYDLITNKILQKLPKMTIKYITQLCNAVLRRGFSSILSLPSTGR